MQRRKRRLDAEERDLWRRVAATATPLQKGPAVALAEPPDRPAPLPAPASAPAPIHGTVHPAPALVPPGFRVGALARGTTAAAPVASPAPPSVGPEARRALRRGRLAPERRIDLHGMTLAEAQGALTGFVLSAHAEGLRLVLVITGKGRGEGGVGALRRQVPVWLGLPPLRPLVIEWGEAERRHGGGGALYVRLRRRR